MDGRQDGHRLSGLTFGSPARFWVWAGFKPQVGHQACTVRQGLMNKTPADLEITQAALPVGVHLPAASEGHAGDAGIDQVHGGHGHDQAQPFERRRIADFTGFELKARRLVIQEKLFGIEAQAVFVEGGQAGRFITDNRPAFVAARGLHMRRLCSGPA